MAKHVQAIRKAYPGEEWDWFHLTGFIHDLGKLLLLPQFGALPQWAVVGDTFPVGCRFHGTSPYTTCPQCLITIIHHYHSLTHLPSVLLHVPTPLISKSSLTSFQSQMYFMRASNTILTTTTLVTTLRMVPIKLDVVWRTLL